MKYIIGVDGGGTKTDAVAYSLGGIAMADGHSGFGNLLTDFNMAAGNIICAIEQCMKTLQEAEDEMECICIYLGIAGIEAGDNKRKLETLIQNRFCCDAEGFHDAVLAQAALFKGEDGIISIAGTGSVCYGVYNDRHSTTGGWGHLLGDEGSGYYIAIEAFKRMIIEKDSGWSESGLTQAFLNIMKITDVKDIKSFVYSVGKAEIAALAPIVVELANGGEINSVEIVKQAGKELAIMTARLHKKLEINGSFRVGISGSILSKAEFVRTEFNQYIEENLEQVEIINEDFSATKGAYYLHLKIAEGKKYEKGDLL